MKLTTIALATAFALSSASHLHRVEEAVRVVVRRDGSAGASNGSDGGSSTGDTSTSNGTTGMGIGTGADRSHFGTSGTTSPSGTQTPQTGGTDPYKR